MPAARGNESYSDLYLHRWTQKQQGSPNNRGMTPGSCFFTQAPAKRVDVTS